MLGPDLRTFNTLVIACQRSGLFNVIIFFYRYSFASGLQLRQWVPFVVGRI